MNMQPNALTRGIIAACRESPFRDKLLAAPTSRIGRQWLDQAARYGATAINMRVVGVRRLIRDLAGPALRKASLSHPTVPERYAVIRAALAADRSGSGYFSSLKPTLNVLAMLDRSFADLADAGVDDADRLLAGIHPESKARELARLYGWFQTRLAAAGFAPPGLVFAEAAAALRKQGRTALLLVPEDFLADLTGYERRFVELWPEKRRKTLPVDKGVKARLSFCLADGDLNEARAVFRFISENGVKLDQVEAVPMTSAGAAALCEAAREYFSPPEGDMAAVEDLPLTFADGLPGGWSRPERLVAAWTAWLAGERRAADLARLCAAGLLKEERLAEYGSAAWRLGSMLLALPAEPGAKGILAALPALPERDPATRKLCRAFCRDVLSPLASDPGAKGILRATAILLNRWCAARGELDNYAMVRLLEDDFLAGRVEPWPDFDAREWLEGLAGNMRLMGQGPQPGKLHVSGRRGGHSGREYTFVMNLDEGSFPGGDVQDPVLLDSERKRLSGDLPLAAERRADRENELAALLARVRGSARLSASRLDLAGPAELHPAEAFLERLGEALPEPAAFVPSSPRDALSVREFVVASLLPRAGGPDAAAAFSGLYPWLARGGVAAADRAGGTVNAHNGLVPEAGRDFVLGDRLFSASRLECLSNCQLEYFFKYVLELREPDRHVPARNAWLEANDRGTFLHQVYNRFSRKLRGTGKERRAAEAAGILQTVFAETFAEWERRTPPRDKLVYARERRDLLEAGRVFLHEELKNLTESEPAHLEAVFGMNPAADEETLGEAVEITLPSGRAFRLHGRIDRIDRRAEGGLEVWDYKTGDPSSYDAGDLFAGGERLQAGLYMIAVERLSTGRERVVRSGYYFPTRIGGGAKAPNGPDDRRLVLERIDFLLALLERGEFPFAPLKGNNYDPYEFSPLFKF